jgi:uncharacterized membrane protein
VEVVARARRHGPEVNTGPLQRVTSLVAGAALVTAGVRRRSLGGLVAALVGGDLLYRGSTGYCHVLGALGIDMSRDRLVNLQRSITVERPRDDTYRRWCEPETQALVWSHFAQATDASEEGAHWRAELPLRRKLDWDVRVVEERDGELIRWEAIGDLLGEGVVEFRDAPGDHGTEVTLRVRFDPPGGPLGDVAVQLLDDPPKLVLAKALRRFKSLVESGEIPSTDRTPSARVG